MLQNPKKKHDKPAQKYPNIESIYFSPLIQLQNLIVEPIFPYI